MPVLVLQGAPKERGEQHGEAFRAEIQELAKIRKELLRGFLKSFSKEKIEKLANEQSDVLKKYPHFYEEFMGISDSSKVSPEDLMILNNYTDMRDFGGDERHNDGCSSFSVAGKGEYICGQTWDMHASAEPYMLHLSIPKSDKNPVAVEVLTVKGCLALAGANQFGVSVLINNLNCNETRVGLMWPALVRGILLQNSVHNAKRYLEYNLPSSGHNYLISDPKESVSIETTGKRTEVTHQFEGTGIAIHTNHYISSLKNIENTKKVSATSHARYEALDKYMKTVLSSGAVFNLEKATTDLLTHGNNPTLCVAASEDPHASATCGGIVFDLKRKTGESFMGFYENKKRHAFKL